MSTQTFAIDQKKYNRYVECNTALKKFELGLDAMLQLQPLFDAGLMSKQDLQKEMKIIVDRLDMKKSQAIAKQCYLDGIL